MPNVTKYALGVEGIEPSASFLSGTRSTTEPHAHKNYLIILSANFKKFKQKENA